MAKSGPASFRRVLLSRILLLSIPVLLAGEYVTYRKARQTLLTTARQNLMESADRNSENIRDRIDAMRATLGTAAEAFVPTQNPNAFLQRLNQRLPEGVQCLQLTQVATQQVMASTCGPQPLTAATNHRWSPSEGRSPVHITPALLPSLGKAPVDPLAQLSLVFSAPIYDRAQQVQYTLDVKASLLKQQPNRPRSLAGSTVVIDQSGTIFAHPRAERLGQNVQQEADAVRLKDIVAIALKGEPDYLGFFSFEKYGDDWLVGYSKLSIALTPTETREWVVLAATPLGTALAGLEGIKQVLWVLTIGLVGANFLATVYLSRDLARPIEQLNEYALSIYQRQPSDRAPKNFKIRELKHLGVALDSMVETLEERAIELETAWQEAQVANQLKSEFLATTSHELRTPLNAIIGCVRLVRDGCCDSPEEEMEFLQQADEAAVHLLKIINDLLDIEKIEAGKVELNLQPVSIPDLCQQSLKMVQAGAEKKRINLSLEVDPNLSQIALDERRVRQMVINLLSNAVKFTSEGGRVKLVAQLAFGGQLAQDMRPDRSPINASTPYLCLGVVDSGIGIPKERWHLLFRPFQQIDSKLTRKHEGTGLGLALTKRLAELHGGTMSFQSTSGVGSTFRIWLPAQGVDVKPTIADVMSEIDRLAWESVPDRPEPAIEPPISSESLPHQLL